MSYFCFVVALAASNGSAAPVETTKASAADFAKAQEPRLSDVLGRWEMTFATAEGLDAPGELEIKPPFAHQTDAAQVYIKGLDPRGSPVGTVSRAGGLPGVRGFREGSFQFAVTNNIFTPLYEYLFRCRVSKKDRLLCQVAPVVRTPENNWSAELARWYMGFRRIQSK